MTLFSPPLAQQIAAQFHSASAQHAMQHDDAEPLRLAIAYSGGLDSTVLLHLAAKLANAPLELFAFHIHHGISPHADAWLAHCVDTCAQLGVRFAGERIALRDWQGEGLEQAAREQRYAALGQLCRQHQVTHLLTAHHLDDQAETVLLQMLRGSGVAGLAAMDSANIAQGLLGDPHTVIMRPLLAVSRAQLQAYSDQHQLQHIEDESNLDPRYTRNALRLQVMPALAQVFPGFQARLARTSEHARAAQSLLNEMAESDLQQCQAGEQLLRAPLMQLRPERRNNLLRYWLAQHEKRMPSTNWLRELWQQLASEDENVQVCVSNSECQIRLYRGKVYLTPCYDRQPPEVESQHFQWQGEASLRFDAFQGVLEFVPCVSGGIALEVLQAAPLEIHYRRGGERFRFAASRPSRPLKQQYQSKDIPTWIRQFSPLVSSAKQLLFVPGLGLDAQFQTLEEQVPQIMLRWLPDL